MCSPTFNKLHIPDGGCKYTKLTRKGFLYPLVHSHTWTPSNVHLLISLHSGSLSHLEMVFCPSLLPPTQQWLKDHRLFLSHICVPKCSSASSLWIHFSQGPFPCFIFFPTCDMLRERWGIFLDTCRWLVLSTLQWLRIPWLGINSSFHKCEVWMPLLNPNIHTVR